MGFFRIFAAIPGFFLSAFLLMLIWGWLITPELGLATISYVHSMLITVVLWIAIAPLAAAGKGWKH